MIGKIETVKLASDGDTQYLHDVTTNDLNGWLLLNRAGSSHNYLVDVTSKESALSSIVGVLNYGVKLKTFFNQYVGEAGYILMFEHGGHYHILNDVVFGKLVTATFNSTHLALQYWSEVNCLTVFSTSEWNR